MSDPADTTAKLAAEDRQRRAWPFRLSVVFEHASAVIMLVTMVAVAGNALLRYIFHAGTSGVYDVARYSFLFVIFLGLTRTNLAGGHAQVRLVLALLPPRVQYILLNRVVPLLAMAYMAGLFVSGLVMTWHYAAAGTHTAGVVAIAVAPLTAIIPLTTALFLVVQAMQLGQHWRLPADEPDHDGDGGSAAARDHRP